MHFTTPPVCCCHCCCCCCCLVVAASATAAVLLLLLLVSPFTDTGWMSQTLYATHFRILIYCHSIQRTGTAMPLKWLTAAITMRAGDLWASTRSYTPSPLWLVQDNVKSDIHRIVCLFVCLFVCFLQVQNNRTNLLRHPLIISLLDLKWRTFGRFTYFPNLLTYVIFVTSITTFALLSLNPQSNTCKLAGQI